MPEQLGSYTDSAGQRKLELARFAKRLSAKRVTPSRGTVLKAAAALVALCLLSTILPGIGGGYEPRAWTTASPGPFSPPVMVNDNEANDQSVPVIVAIPGGGLVVVWQDTRVSIQYPDIYASRSLDNGTTFAPSRRVDDSIGFSEQRAPAVAVSGNGTILVAWQDNRRSWADYDIFFAKSYDGGTTFSKNVKADDSTSGISWQERPSITVTSGGTVYVAWTDDRTGHLRIRGAYSTDVGTTFSRSEEVVPTGSTSAQDQVSVVSNGNRIFAAFTDNVSGTPHPYLCYSTNGGKNFTVPIRLDNTSSGVAQKGVTIAPMPGGGVVAAWEDNRGGNWDIYSCTVSANGKIVTSDHRVDDDSTGSVQQSVSVAADQLGNIYAAWEDQRSNLNAIRVAYLVADGVVFNSSVEVASPGGNDLQKVPSIIAPEPGRVYVVWQDDKANTDDVYSSTAFFPYLFGLWLDDGWSFVSILTNDFGYKASTLGLKNGSQIADWNSTTQTYTRVYIVGLSPPSSDFPINPSTGYWIKMIGLERLNLKGNVPTSKQYKHIVVPSAGGWAAVGFASLNTTRFASDIPKMTNVSGSITQVASYNPDTRLWKTYIPGLPPSDFILMPGQAYWCFCTVNGTLAYTP